MKLTETMTLYPEDHINSINTVSAKGGSSNVRAGGKYRNCQADHPAPSDAKVKNEWRYTSTPPTCHYGIHRDIFHWLANFSEKIPSSEADSFSSSQEILRVLWKPNVQYRVLKIPLIFYILTQINPVYALSP
jgi:hypothetical protein